MAWRDHLRGSLAAKTISDVKLSTVRSMLKWAVENEKRPENVAATVNFVARITPDAGAVKAGDPAPGAVRNAPGLDPCDDLGLRHVLGLPKNSRLFEEMPMAPRLLFDALFPSTTA